MPDGKPVPKPTPKPKKDRGRHYREVVRPLFLMRKAREQDRLREIPDGPPKKVYDMLPPEERPLCGVQAPGTECAQRRRIGNWIHHLRGRGEDVDDPELMVNTCSECHDTIHDHPAWARREGWMLSRL